MWVNCPKNRQEEQKRLWLPRWPPGGGGGRWAGEVQLCPLMWGSASADLQDHRETLKTSRTTKSCWEPAGSDLPGRRSWGLGVKHVEGQTCWRSNTSWEKHRRWWRWRYHIYIYLYIYISINIYTYILSGTCRHFGGQVLKPQKRAPNATKIILTELKH